MTIVKEAFVRMTIVKGTFVGMTIQLVSRFPINILTPAAARTGGHDDFQAGTCTFVGMTIQYVTQFPLNILSLNRER